MPLSRISSRVAACAAVMLLAPDRAAVSQDTGDMSCATLCANLAVGACSGRTASYCASWTLGCVSGCEFKRRIK